MRFIPFLFFLLAAISIQGQDIVQFQTFWGYQYYVDAQLISKQEVENKLALYEGAAADWKRAKQADVLSWCFLSAELGFSIWSISKISNNQAQFPMRHLAGTVALGAGAIAFQFRRKKMMKQALLSYNHLNNGKPELSLSKDGIGLVLQF